MSEDYGQSQQEMPKYRCHKEVHALKIKGIDFDADMGQEGAHIASIIPVEEGYGPVRINQAYLDKHKPQAGGYYVVYEGGYLSWSPAEAFESGYKLIE